VHHKGQNSESAREARTPPVDRPLDGIAVLVLEDEPIVALDLQDILEQAGATVIGPAHTLKQALELMTRSTLDCALLDVRLGNDGTSFPAAERLAEQNIRWVFYTGDADASALRRDWPSCDVIFKPVQPEQLIAVIAASSRG
jgi:two-component SAPR family response regulator